MTERVMDNLGWWAIRGEYLRELLQRVADGEDPELVYIGAYAEIAHINGKDD